MVTKKKYELTSETIEFNGVTLHRIKALKDFSDVKAGDLGGWIEKEENLSQINDAWIGGDAIVYGNAEICGDAKVYDNAEVYGNALVFGKSKVYGNARICGNALVFGKSKVYGNARICGNEKVCGDARVHNNAMVGDNARVFVNVEVFGNAQICGNAVVKNNEDYIVFKNFWSSGRYFTWTRSNNMWKVGCFYGTGEELIEKAYKDSERSGKEYERVVRYVNSILADE